MIVTCCSFVAVVLGALLFVTTHATPEGMFDEPRVAVGGYCYYEFRDGKVSLVSEYFLKPVGTYYKRNDEWRWVGLSGNELRLHATLTQIRVVALDGTDDRALKRLLLRPRTTSTSGPGKKESSP